MKLVSIATMTSFLSLHGLNNKYIIALKIYYTNGQKKNLINGVVTKPYFLSECSDFSCFWIYLCRNMDKLSMKYQSYSKSRKIKAFGQEKDFCHSRTDHTGTFLASFKKI